MNAHLLLLPAHAGYFKLCLSAKLLYVLNMGKRLLYEDNYRRVIIKVGEKEASVRNPIAFYHLALMEYNPNLRIEQIVLFEKMLVFYQLNNSKPFEYQQIRLQEQLHISRIRLENARLFLKGKGILEEVNPGRGKRIWYSLNLERINALLPELYKMPEDESEKRLALRNLRLFFSNFFVSEKVRNRVDPSIPDVIHEGRTSISGTDKRKFIKGDRKEDENSTYKVEE